MTSVITPEYLFRAQVEAVITEFNNALIELDRDTLGNRSIVHLGQPRTSMPTGEQPR